MILRGDVKSINNSAKQIRVLAHSVYRAKESGCVILYREMNVENGQQREPCIRFAHQVWTQKNEKVTFSLVSPHHMSSFLPILVLTHIIYEYIHHFPNRSAYEVLAVVPLLTRPREAAASIHFTRCGNSTSKDLDNCPQFSYTTEKLLIQDSNSQGQWLWDSKVQFPQPKVSSLCP